LFGQLLIWLPNRLALWLLYFSHHRYHQSGYLYCNRSKKSGPTSQAAAPVTYGCMISTSGN
jgi:hypothetical protein